MKRYSILSVGVDSLSGDEFLLCARTLLDSESQSQIVTVNPEFIMEARANERFRGVLNVAHCALADGFGLIVASFILFSKNVFHRMTGVQATLLLAGIAAELDRSVYLVGAREGVAFRAAEILLQRYPSLRIVGAEVGMPFSSIKTPSENTDDLLTRINTQKPDIVFVAFGAPKQELWIADHLSQMPSVKLAMGVGGTFDYLSGLTPYAPSWLRAIGLEWLYRLIREPHRFNRIITATIRFPLAVLFSKIRPTRKQ